MSNKTVRVRIAVAVDSDGEWGAAGHSGYPMHATSDDNAARKAREMLVNPETWLGPTEWPVHFIEADVPLPIPAEVQHDQ